jgi:cytochrome bd-type quinol oxidase subunit 1
MMYLILIAVVVSGLILVQPAWLGGVGLGAPGVWRNPLGIMPLKYVGLFVISVCCGFLLLYDVIFLSAYKESQWGNLPRASRAAAAIAGFTGMWLLVVMGYIRESGRSPWTIYGIVPVPGGQLYPTPIALPTIFVIWAAILGLALVVYWFTSRMTASHPEQMEG